MEEDNIQQKGLHPMIKINIAAMTQENDMATIESEFKIGEIVQTISTGVKLRIEKFYEEFLTPKEFKFTCFPAEESDEMIVQTNIPFYSLCQHHHVPFFGVAHVAYIPNKKIVGLSKLARTVDLYANRFQNQERITTQIAERLQSELNPLGIAVVLKAQHLCMCMRGVKKHDTWTSTSKMLGVFKKDLNARNEFLSLIKK